MLYIRRKDNPLIIKAWGEVSEGGLGVFDANSHEEVMADELPEGWQLEEQPKAPAEQLQDFYKSLPVLERIKLAEHIKLLILLLDLGDEEGAQAYLQVIEASESTLTTLATILNS